MSRLVGSSGQISIRKGVVTLTTLLIKCADPKIKATILISCLFGNSGYLNYSLRKDLIGLVKAALIA